MAGLAPANLRLLPETPANDEAEPITVDVGHSEIVGHPMLEIEHADGTITISLDGKPLGEPANEGPTGWFDDLSDKIDSMELSRIAEELLRGIGDDLESRKEWITDREQGIKLLGLKVEIPGLQGATDGAPVEGMSKVRHPLLLEAVLRFQANARSELLPTDGPVKIRDDNNGDTAQDDSLANDLEQDMNHYLTAVAKEYYPDTDRMLLMLGFGGTSFKKVYYCPLRSRPVSESVDANDLIVNASATDLHNAKRITHRVYMRPSTVKRLQILGVYRDIPMHMPNEMQRDAVQLAEKSQQGISPDVSNPDDRDREIYECYCELDIKGFEHKHKGKISGLEIPYRVTIDVTSREILSLVRNYDEDTKELPEARPVFVKYTFVPGLGFYDIGLLHILGNTTNAITAAWRELLDSGMFANFPGFLIAKNASRQNTSVFRVQPGGGAQVDIGGAQSIKDAIMPLPYQTTGMAPLMNLVGDMAQTGMRIGGTSEQMVGEGRADAPVGTTLAMIEQAAKVLNSVHKRMHASQAEEFQMLKACFREHPESFWQRKCKSPTKWDEAKFISALENCEFVPQADPNTASHAQRVMKVQALNLWQQANPSLADPIAIAKVSLEAMGWSNPDQFMAPPEAMGQPPPELQEIQAGIKVAQQQADAKTMDAQSRAMDAKTKAAEAQAKLQQGLGAAHQQEDTPVDVMTAKAKLMDAETKRRTLGLQAHEVHIEDHNRDLDREAKARENVLDLAKTIMGHMADARQAAAEVKPIEREIGAKS